tara:strand:+ start:4078 stop:5172 length:1095 start_codon:yes stop_codon:yes gene_type:complete
LVENIERVGKYKIHKMKRRKFLKNSLLGITGLPIINSNGLNFFKENSEELFFELSLAQFSLFRPIMNKQIDPYDFAKIAREEGFKGLEYMSAIYKGGLMSFGNQKKSFGLKEAKEFAKKSKTKSDEFGLENLLIMVDGEGDLSNEGTKKGMKSVENHHKWVDAAYEMGCHSVRVNLYGSSDEKIWLENSIRNLNKLCEYAKGFNINIIIENHNSLSSNADLLLKVIKNIDYDNFGTLPDFGNWCLEFDQEIIKTVYSRFGNKDKNKDDSDFPTMADACKSAFDKYEGMRKILPYAKGVSAKSELFDDTGENITFDYKKMMQIVKDSGYRGYIGVEYGAFGSNMSSIEGIRATKNLIYKSARQLQ